MSGWIKIHRKILDWEWYDDIKTFKVFIHLLMKANHKARNYKGVLIKEGEVMTGQELLSSELKMSRQNVRTSLNRLKSTNEITIKSSRKGSIIQVVKYEDYQMLTNHLTTFQPEVNQQLTSNNNDNNYKKDIKSLIKCSEACDLMLEDEEVFIAAKGKDVPKLLGVFSKKKY